MKAHTSHNFKADGVDGPHCVRCGCRFFNLFHDGIHERAQVECPGRTTPALCSKDGTGGAA